VFLFKNQQIKVAREQRRTRYVIYDKWLNADIFKRYTVTITTGERIFRVYKRILVNIFFERQTFATTGIFGIEGKN
jgi:hypothetical protein